MTAINHDIDRPNPLTDLLALTYVTRWSIVPMTRTQSVAEHVYRTQVITMELCKRLALPQSVTLGSLMWALYHDSPEARTGDIMGSFKPFIERTQTSIPAGAYSDVLHTAELAVMPWIADIERELHQGPAGACCRAIVKLADLIEALVWLRHWGNPSSPHAYSIQGKMSMNLRPACERLATTLETAGQLLHWAAPDQNLSVLGNCWAVTQSITDEITAESGRRTDPKP